MNVTLGQTGITTSMLALGCARLGSVLTPLDRRACVRLIDEAYEFGVRHFDTASIYGQGDSERYIGEALERHRGNVCLSSKAGQRLSPKQSLLANFKAPIRWMAARRGSLRSSVSARRSQGVPRCFDPDYIETSLRATLKRLRTDHLDIFYLHSPNVGVLADEALMVRIEHLREQGLFRAFGVSCDDDQAAWEAAVHEAVQVLQFAFDGSSHGSALLRELHVRRKHAVVRGLMPAQSGERVFGESLTLRFEQVLSLPALGGVIVGTTNAQHLRDNVAAFMRARPAGHAA